MSKEQLNKILEDIEEQFNNLTDELYEEYSYNCGLLTIVDNSFKKFKITDSEITDEESEIISQKFETCYRQYRLLNK